MSSGALKNAAKSALAHYPDAGRHAVGAVSRVTVDVVSKDEHELVSCRLRGRELSWSCSCTQVDCEHGAVALRMLAELDSDHEALASTDDLTLETGGLLRQSDAPPRPSDVPVQDRPYGVLAEALEDVVTAVVRTGVNDKESPSVLDSLQRLGESLPKPLPLGLSRWIGRMRLALAESNVGLVARLLDGAVKLLNDLQEGSEGQQVQMACWLGGSQTRSAVKQVSDRVMIELGRELLDGVSRGCIERRHLLDLATGRVYREERPRGRSGASFGTCPRIVFVGLAEVEYGIEPQRIRLLQYVSSPSISRHRWVEALAWVSRDFAPLIKHYRTALTEFPATAEPVALVAAEQLASDGELTLVDDHGCRLPLFSGRGCEIDYLAERLNGAHAAFVLGRLIDRDDVLHLRPVAFGVQKPEGGFFLDRV